MPWNTNMDPWGQPAPGSLSSPFATEAERDAAYPVAPTYAVEAYVGTPLSSVQYRYVGPGVGPEAWVANITTPIDFASLPVCADGSTAICPMILGPGTFRVRRELSLWVVQPGECVFLAIGPDRLGYSLTAASTSTVVLASATIPAGLIKIGETWATTTHASKSVHVGGADIVLARFESLAIGNGTTIATSAPAYHVGDVDVSWQSSTSVLRRLGSGKNNEGVAGGPNAGLPTINSATTFSIALTPGAAGNVLQYHAAAFRRVS